MCCRIPARSAALISKLRLANVESSPERGSFFSPFGRGRLATSDGWCNAPPMSSEETPPTPSPPDGEDSAPFLPPLPTKSSILRGPQFFLPEEKETAPAGACRRPTAAERRLLGRRQTGRARSTGRLLMALPFRAVASPLRGKEKKKYTAFLSVEQPVGAAALRPPLAALPLTAAAYPLRVFGGPSPRKLHAIHGPFPRAHPSIGRPFP